MSPMQNGKHETPGAGDDEDVAQLLLQGVTLHQEPTAPERAASTPAREEADEDIEVSPGTDVQGALGLFAEAAQDMATATVELGLGRHFACADFCNQAAEKAAQSVSLLRYGRRSRYDHDLRTLGTIVGAPPQILDELDILTPFHPETFYADTPPEEADEIISAQQASSYVQSARTVLRWARGIILQ
ncbi:MAG TPA: HEPN domain-containing protein [Ktedonobacteraceae bacterium]|nr:HEPN domain-containing protein [Ktedonobacteraceae bacterium]